MTEPKDQRPGRPARLVVRGMTCTHCEVTVRRAGYEPGPLELLNPDDPAPAAPAGTAPTPAPATPASPAPAAAAAPAPAVMPVLGALPSTRGATRGADEYDLGIVGSGAAAFAAAIEASQRGARVAMVERGVVGGTCVNVGCVPSKTLLRAAEVHFRARHHPFAGLQTQAGPVDMGLLVGQKNELVARLRREKYERLVDEYGFDLIRGEGRFVDAHTLEVVEPGDGSAAPARAAAPTRTLRARAWIVATGASPAVPDIPGLEAVDYLTSTTALELRRVPEHLAVIGAGYIALELGQLFRHLGSRVTLMQRSPRLLKGYDPEIAAAVHQMLDEQGIEVLTGVRYVRVEGSPGGARVVLEVAGARRVVEADALLVATGRQPNTRSLRLDRAGVELGPRGEIRVDDRLQTTAPSIYAAGDVTLGPQFVYVAAYEGALAAVNALGAGDRRVDLGVVPRVTFTTPSIASVGMTEEQARAAGHAVRTSVLPLEAVPRALANRETRGVIKLVADGGSGRLLGAHVVADQAGEVIYAATLAVKAGLTIQDLRETLAPYLTMAEGLKLAALAFDVDVSRLSCCAG